jgi:hypothetical protein
MEDRPLTPLGHLLEHARVNDVGISGREAARRAGISEGRWRHIVRGSQARSSGDIPVTAPARTIVAMAMAVEVDPTEALKTAGMDIPAEEVSAMIELRRRPKLVQSAEPATNRGPADEIDRIRNLRGISPKDKIRMVQAILDLYEESAETEDGR